MACSSVTTKAKCAAGSDDLISAVPATTTDVSDPSSSGATKAVAPRRLPPGACWRTVRDHLPLPTGSQFGRPSIAVDLAADQEAVRRDCDQNDADGEGIRERSVTL